MTINNKKSELRQYVQKLKEEVSAIDRLIYSQVMFDRIENLEVFQEAENILLYWSMENEVQTHNFIRKCEGSKAIYLPLIRNDNLEIKKYTGKMNMRKTATLTLFEPADSTFVDPDDIDLVITPGLAFDRNNNRLGHGKGYYDRLLAGMHVYKIGICFHFQLFNEIPCNLHDVRMDMVITN